MLLAAPLTVLSANVPKKIALCNKITHNAFRISNFSYELSFECSPYAPKNFSIFPLPHAVKREQIKTHDSELNSSL